MGVWRCRSLRSDGQTLVVRRGLTHASWAAEQTGVGDASCGCQIVHRGRPGGVSAEQRAIQRAGRLDHLPALCQFPLSLLFLKHTYNTLIARALVTCRCEFVTDAMVLHIDSDSADVCML